MTPKLAKMYVELKKTLSNQKWAKLKPLLLPEPSGNKERPYVGHRKTPNGILWRRLSSCLWRDIAKCYTQYQTFMTVTSASRIAGLLSHFASAPS
jgi:transposase